MEMLILFTKEKDKDSQSCFLQHAKPRTQLQMGIIREKHNLFTRNECVLFLWRCIGMINFLTTKKNL